MSIEGGTEKTDEFPFKEGDPVKIPEEYVRKEPLLDAAGVPYPKDSVDGYYVFKILHDENPVLVVVVNDRRSSRRIPINKLIEANQ
jgi:hypothetical protein